MIGLLRKCQFKEADKDTPIDALRLELLKTIQTFFVIPNAKLQLVIVDVNANLYYFVDYD